MKHGRRLFAVSVLILAAGALAVRLPRLDQRPMHCDEANQAVKAGTGVYHYDSHDHHGPSLYWLTLPALRLQGVSCLAASNAADYRIVPVVFGAALVLLLLLLSDGLGRGAIISAALLTAISPAMVYYSRYYIQEMLLVFFTTALICCGWRYFRSGRIGWAIGAGAMLGLMHATKETWVLAAAAMVGAIVVTYLWEKRYGRISPLPPGEGAENGDSRNAFRLRLLPIAAAIFTACIVATAFYSSFGTNWSAPIDSLLAYKNYVVRGTENGLHNNPWYFYLELLVAFHPSRGFVWSEGLIVALAVVGGIVSFMPNVLSGQQRTFGRFLAAYTLILTILYSAIPYKTPWCMLSFLQGMILLAGVGTCAISRWETSRRAWPKLLVCGLLAAGVAHLGWECYVLNFRLQNDWRNPYVYAQTSSDAVRLGQQMERLALASPDGHDMLIDVVTPETYWPLPWYLRQFNVNHIGYWQDADQWSRDVRKCPPPSVIIVSPEFQPIVDRQLPAVYNRQRIYGLRPGVLMAVYVREDLWEADSK